MAEAGTCLPDSQAAALPQSGIPAAGPPLSPPSCSGAPPGVHEQVPLQPRLQASSQPGHGRVSEQGQFVENASAKVVSDHREAVIGALELWERRRHQTECAFPPRGSPAVLPTTRGCSSSHSFQPGAGTDRGGRVSVPGPGSYP